MFNKYLRFEKLSARLVEDARAVSIGPMYAIILIAMLFVDLAFIAWSGIQGFQGLPRDIWHISVDRSIPEFWQYAKFATLTLTLLLMFRERHSFVYLAFAVLCFYFLVDDSMMVHERLGRKFSQYFALHPAFGLRSQDFGELIVTGIASVSLFGFLLITYLMESSKEVRSFSHVMLLLVAAIAAFGVGVDMLDVMVPWYKAKLLLGLIEDGGEMIAATVMVTYVLATMRTNFALVKSAA